MHIHPVEKFNQYQCPAAVHYHFIHVLQGCTYWYLKIMLTAGCVKAPDGTGSLASPLNLKRSIKRVTAADGLLSLAAVTLSLLHSDWAALAAGHRRMGLAGVIM